MKKKILTILISSNPKILGGMWCIDGTRIPIERFIALQNMGHSLKELIKDYQLEDKIKECYDK